MIELVNVSKYYPTDFGRHYVFRDVSLLLPLDKSVGVLGPNGAGKSTFLRLLGGADMPSEGKIIKTGRISPPMGLTPGLQSTLTAGENTRFAGRIYGLSRDEINDTIEYVRNLADIGKFFDMPVSTYSAGMRQRVAFAINMSMEFDYYLFDEIGAGGDKEFRKITSQMVQERLKTSKFIIASHRVDELLDICDSGIVIQNGELAFFDDIKDALAAYGETEGEDSGRARRNRLQPLLAEDGTEIESREARKERILAKRALMRQQREERRLAAAAAPVSAAGDAPPADAEPPGEAQVMPVVAQAEETGESREARKERILAKRALTRQQRIDSRETLAAAQAEKPMPLPPPPGIPPDVTEVLAQLPVAEPEGSDEGLDSRIARLREKREQMRAQRAGWSAAEQAADSAEAATATASAPAGGKESRKARVERLRSNRERVGRERQEREAAPVQEAATAAPLLAVTAASEDNSAGRRLALQSQLRAQVKSARASRLLLQHLDSLSGGERDGTRAALVSLAQENAAREAAEAREMRDGSRSSMDIAPQPALVVPGGAPRRQRAARHATSDT